MNIKVFLFSCCLVLCGGLVFAQSAADMELAKQLARQQGYSDAQIKSMIQRYEQKDANRAKNESGTVINRNAAVLQQQMQIILQWL